MNNRTYVPHVALLAALGLQLLSSSRAADYAATVSGLGPVAYYRFSITNQISEARAANLGTLGSDFSGTYEAMSATRGITGALAGDSDTAVTVDGRTGQQITVAVSEAYNPAGPFTVEFWSRPESTGGATQTAIISMVNGHNAANGDDRSGWAIYHNGTSWFFRLGFDHSDGATFYHTTMEAPGSVLEGVWQHVVAVYTPSLISLYVNGQLAASEAPAMPVVPNRYTPLIIGDRGYTGWDYSGGMDEVAIYASALSASDILAHYQNGTSANRATPYADLVLAKNPPLYLRLGEPPLQLPSVPNEGSLGAVGNGTMYPGSTPGVAGLQASTSAGFSATNTAIRFDGITGFVGTALQELFLVPNFTLACWLKPEGTQPNRTGVAGQNDVLEFGWHDAATQFGPWTPAGFASAAPSTVRIDEWNHAVIVADGATLKLIINGVEAASADSPWDGLTAAFNFNMGGGGILDSGANYFRGLMDEVAVFDKALSTEEIASIYNAALPAIVGVSRSPADPVFEGASVTFRVSIAGNGPFTYEWRKDGTAVTGGNGASLTLASVTPADAGQYDVRVTRGGVTLTSPPIALAIQGSPPTLSRTPVSSVRLVNGTARMSVSAAGTQPITYEWKHNGTVIAGATGAELELKDLQTADAGEYTVTASNPLGSVSATATLTVVVPTKLAAAITDLGPLAYWRLDEASGTNAFDYWGGLDGGATAGVTNSVIGPRPSAHQGFDAANTAYEFSGTSSRVVVPAPSLNLTTTHLTIVAWIKPSGTQDDFDGLVFSRGGSTVSGLDYQQGGQLGYHWNDAAATYNFASGLYPEDGVWNFVALVVEPEQAVVYLDSGSGLTGSPNAVTHGSAQFNGPLRLGADSDTGRFFRGAIDDVAVYGRALTQAEITLIRNAGFQGTYAPRPATIVQQPKGGTILVGSSQTLAVEVAGSVPIQFQWQKDGVNLPGAIRSSLTLDPAAVSDSGTYRVIITQGTTSVTSDPAVLSVRPVPTSINLADGLVVHLKFDGTAQDSSGRNNHGTVMGSPTFPAGKIGSGALGYSTEVTGGAVTAANYVTLGKPADLQFGASTSFSVAFWIQFTGSPGDLPFLCNNSDSYGGAGFVLAPSYETGSWSWSLNDGTSPVGWPGVAAQYGNDAGYANSLNDGAWHHLVIRVDRTGDVTTFQDGVKVHAKTIAGLGFNPDTGLDVTIGQGNGGGYGVPGSFRMDDLGIWRKALTDYDAQAIYLVGQNHGRSFDEEAAPDVTLGIVRAAGGVTLSWTTGTLESADALAGPWSTVAGASAPSYTTPTDQAQKFYRVKVGN